MTRRKKRKAPNPLGVLAAWIAVAIGVVLAMSLAGGTLGVAATVLGLPALIGLQIMLSKTRPKQALALTVVLVLGLCAGIVVATA